MYRYDPTVPRRGHGVRAFLRAAWIGLLLLWLLVALVSLIFPNAQTAIPVRSIPAIPRVTLTANVAPPLATTPPATAIISNAHLHLGTVLQDFSRDPAGGWVFSQLQSGTANQDAGNMSLSHTSNTGVVDSWMMLTGFGHGVSIGAQRVGGTLYVWTEALSVDGYGTAIARIRWQPGATVTSTSAGVTIYRCNAGAAHQSPSLLLSAGLIGVRYQSPTLGMRFAVYRLADFTAHSYPALVRITALGGLQGWALTGPSSVAALTGQYYSSTNPPPGNARVWLVDGSASPAVITSAADNTATSLALREPEGLELYNGRLCNGFAAGSTPNQRTQYVYCQ